ncbi:MAG TPA: GTP-binding protein, partial [Desulfocapsa sulfexigens]|nr:GTP-binding protein [Desulfocapsa sulfexigens]
MVAIVGPPNAGKSTLMNYLLGQKISIVSHKPQTTRNRILGVVNGDEYQIVLLDTPGLHTARQPLN